MRKNFRHIKHCLKRSMKSLQFHFSRLKTAVFSAFLQSQGKKNPESIGVFFEF